MASSEHEHGHGHGHIAPVSVYVAIFAALMVLTGLTVFAAYVNLGMFNPLVALGIAAFKATLVILFFMHVKYQSRLTKLVVMTGLFFLTILLTETMMDYASRGFLPMPPGLQ
jgi:cytochrome c oxidase subunit 4